MSVNADFPGNWQAFFQAPTTTTTQTIYSVPTGVRSARIVGLNIAATTGGAAASVWINNGTTDFAQLDAKAITANTSEKYDFGYPALKSGWSVKVKDGTGSKLTFTLTVAEEYRTA